MNRDLVSDDFDLLPYWTAGEGEPLLLIHGIISDSSFFAGTARLLSASYQVITYDRRGYGSAAYSEEMDFSVAAQAQDAAAILTKVCREPAWIVGNSAGALIAIEACMRFPDLVRGLLLVEPSISFDPECRQMMKKWNQELNDYLLSGHIKRVLPAFHRVIGGQNLLSQGSSLAEMKRVYHNLYHFMHGELNEVQGYAPSKRRLSPIHIPVRVIVTDSGRDSIFGRSSQALAKEMGWKLSLLPGYHNTLKDNPVSSANHIRDYVEELKLEEVR